MYSNSVHDSIESYAFDPKTPRFWKLNFHALTLLHFFFSQSVFVKVSYLRHFFFLSSPIIGAFFFVVWFTHNSSLLRLHLFSIIANGPINNFMFLIWLLYTAQITHLIPSKFGFVSRFFLTILSCSQISH